MTNYFKLSLLTTFIKLSPLTFIRLFSGLIRSKLSAIYVGIGLIGIFGQFNQLLLFFTTFGSMGLVVSLQQQISKNRALKNIIKIKYVKGTILSTQIFCILFLLIFYFIFRNQIITYIFPKNFVYTFYVDCLVVFLPLNILSSNYMEAFFSSYEKYNLYVKSSIILTILLLVFFIPGIIFYGINGMFLNLIIGEILIFFLELFFLKCRSLMDLLMWLYHY